MTQSFSGKRIFPSETFRISHCLNFEHIAYAICAEESEKQQFHLTFHFSAILFRRLMLARKEIYLVILIMIISQDRLLMLGA